MQSVPADLQRRLHEHGQEHVLAGWDDLTSEQRSAFVEQLRALDLDLLQQLYAQRGQTYQVPAAERIAPVPVARLNPADESTRRRGEEAFRRGEVAVLLVAGGQGSRLGFEHPKGMFPIGPVSGKSLFQIHAEKVLALRRRYDRPVPFLVMTSPATHAETQAYFAEHRHFGLPAGEVFFFQQGTMPALDLATGRLLLDAPGRLFTSPNGHGGTLTALADSGLLEQLGQHGIRTIYYFQVDNPLVQVGDPLFVGHHLAHAAEVSSKIIPKETPTDKLGNFVLIDGRCSMIEYSDLPMELAQERDASGRLRLRAGSPAIHVFDVEFLGRVTGGPLQIPFHIARKKVPHWDPATGDNVNPRAENALKFEKFIFDVLPLADRWTVVETSRRAEFMPLKNADGLDSPATARQALSDQAGDWLAECGVEVPWRDAHHAAVPLEISPLFALDSWELRSKLPAGFRISGPTYLA